MKLTKITSVVLILLCFFTGSSGQMKSNEKLKQKNSNELNYQGCWSGADKSLTYILFKGNTVQDTRTRKIFHFTEVSKNLETKTVILKLKEELPSRQIFEIKFVTDDEILIGMPMFRDTCKKLPKPGVSAGNFADSPKRRPI